MDISQWEDFFDRHGIEYVTQGKNVGKGNIGLKCPFCGDDPSEHLNIEPEKGWFFCFRNEQHAGKNPYRLLSVLVGPHEARLFLGTDLQKNEEDLLLLLNGTPQPSIKRKKKCQLPGRLYIPSLDIRFKHYLVSRGILEKDVEDFITENQLRVCGEGKYRDRLIIPYLSYDGSEVETFTARAIYSLVGVRYLSPSNDECLAPNQTVWLTFNSGRYRIKSLILMEGPFDKIKASYYDRRWFGCLSTNRATQEQIDVLQRMIQRGYLEEIILLMDRDQPDSRLLLQMKLQDSLGIPVKLAEIKGDYKDAGEVPAEKLMRRNWFEVL